MTVLGLVTRWLRAGAIFRDGALLFKGIFGDDHPFLIVLKNETEPRRQVLIWALETWCKTQQADTDSDYKTVIKKKLEALQSLPAAKAQPDPEPAAKPKLREDFAFLSDPDCPNELKILASNKITAYHNYVSGHEKLFDCTSPIEQLQAAKFVTENFIENRLIHKELQHYKDHRQILGDHPIFAMLKRIRELSKLNVIELIKLKKKLQHNIWRLQSEIDKNNKPHLTPDRERQITEKKAEITEIDRLLARYA